MSKNQKNGTTNSPSGARNRSSGNRDNRGSKGNKRGNKFPRDEERSMDDRYTKRVTKDCEKAGPSKSGMNDISWYTRNPNLIAAAGSFPYPYRPGMQIRDLLTMYANDGTVKANNADFRIPGAIAVSWVPSVGHSVTTTSPVSVTAAQIYAKVREAYSSDLEVDPPDFIMYLMALDNIFSYIAFLKRIYRIINAYSPDNRFIPNELLKCIGGLGDTQIQQLRTNKTRFWQEINTLVLQSRRFKCPAFMDIFNRHYWMNDNVYLDHPSIASQMYIFNQLYWMKFQEVDAQGHPGTKVSGLVYESYPTWSTGVDADVSLYQYGAELIEALTNWDTSYTINGYLKRAYGDVPSFIVDELQLGEVFEPIYSEEVLTQIENIKPLQETPNISSVQITQTIDASIVYSDLSAVPTTYSGNYFEITPILNVRSDNPTIADTVVASRLCSFGVPTVTDASKTVPDATRIYAGTEIVMEIIVCGWNINSTGDPSFTASVLKPAVASGDASPALMASVSQWDWHPITYVVNSSTVDTQAYLFGDITNVTKVDLDALQNLHDVCLYSEFGSYQI